MHFNCSLKHRTFTIKNDVLSVSICIMCILNIKSLKNKHIKQVMHTLQWCIKESSILCLLNVFSYRNHSSTGMSMFLATNIKCGYRGEMTHHFSVPICSILTSASLVHSYSQGVPS